MEGRKLKTEMQIVIPLHFLNKPFLLHDKAIGLYERGSQRVYRPAISTANKHIRSKSNSFPKKMQSRAKKTTATSPAEG